MSSPFQKLSVQVLLILITHILGSLTVFDIKTVNTEGAEEPSVTAMFAAVAEWLVFEIINKKDKDKDKSSNVCGMVGIGNQPIMMS